MKRILSLLLFMSVVLPLYSRTYKHEPTGISFTLPDSWNWDTGGGRVKVTSPDKSVMIEIGLIPEKDQTQAIRQLQHMAIDSVPVVIGLDEPDLDDDFNDVPGITIEISGELDEDHDMEGGIFLTPVKNGYAYMMALISENEDNQYQESFDEFEESFSLGKELVEISKANLTFQLDPGLDLTWVEKDSLLKITYQDSPFVLYIGNLGMAKDQKEAFKKLNSLGLSTLGKQFTINKEGKEQNIGKIKGTAYELENIQPASEDENWRGGFLTLDNKNGSKSFLFFLMEEAGVDGLQDRLEVLGDTLNFIQTP